MAVTIQTKHEDGDATDVPSTLSEGELAVNTQAQKLWVGPIGGGTPVPLISIAEGGWTEGTDPNDLVNTNSGNVGIGTTSPARALEVVGTTATTASLSSNQTQAALAFKDSGTSLIGSVKIGSESEGMFFNAASVERMRITSDGKVGIGTATPNDKLEVLGSTSSVVRLSSNGGANYGGVYADQNGVFILDANVDGTGSASNIRFRNGGTEQMRIDSAGNVGIGTAAPVVKLHVAGGDIAVQSGTEANPSYTFTAQQNLGMFRPASGVMAFTTVGTERMRIDSAGNVGIGSTAPTGKLEVNTGGELAWITRAAGDAGVTNPALAFGAVSTTTRIYSYGDLQFYAAPVGSAAANKMTLDSNGNLLVGGTANPMAGFTCRSYFEGTNSIGPASYRNSNAAAGKGWKMFIDSSNNHLLRNESDVGVRIVDGATAWSASSDERLKDVQGSVEGALDILAPIRPVYYNFKGQDRRMVGVIAQDVQPVLPEAVDVGDDGMLSMRYTDLVPVLVKAIQELTARLEALEA